MNYPAIPNSPAEALAILQNRPEDLPGLDHRSFIALWAALAYLQPGIHPDDWAAAGLTKNTICGSEAIITELWRRAGKGLLADYELYPANAAWAGIFDRIPDPSPEERERRDAIGRYGLAA